MPRHGFLFTHGGCRHLFAQHPPLPQANVTQPIVQNAPAELLNNVELAAAGEWRNLLPGWRGEMQRLGNYMNDYYEHLLFFPALVLTWIFTILWSGKSVFFTMFWHFMDKMLHCILLKIIVNHFTEHLLWHETRALIWIRSEESSSLFTNKFLSYIKLLPITYPSLFIMCFP